MIPSLLVMVSYDVKWRYLTRHLGFYCFLKKSGNNGNLHKLKPKCLENVRIVNFCNSLKKTEKKLHFYLEKVNFWPDQYEICWLPWKRQIWWTRNWHMKIFGIEWRNSYLNFQPLTVNRLFKTLKKTLWGSGGGIRNLYQKKLCLLFQITVCNPEILNF